MKKFIFFCIVIGFGWHTQAQVRNYIKGSGNIKSGRFNELDTISDKLINVKILGKTKFTDYKIISYNNDTTYIDTTLTIKKDFKHSFNLKDNFEFMPFENMGQTGTKLGFDFNDIDKYPLFGATAMLFDFLSVKDINYYSVPTPTTIFTHKTGFQQGQMLNSLLTMNTSKRLNFSLSYKGLRSLGAYRNELTSHGHVKFSLNYRTKNDKYSIRGHMVNQDLTNNENGGLIASDILLFENNDPQFTQRGRLDINLNDAVSVLRTNRYYFEQDYKLWQRKDSLSKRKTYLRIGHVYNHQLSRYEFNQGSVTTSVFWTGTGSVNDKLILNKVYNKVFVGLKAPTVLGEVTAKLENYHYDYGYAQDTTVTTTTYGNQLKGNSVAFGGTWKAHLKGFYLNADASNILTGPLNGNKLKVDAILKKDSVYSLMVGVLATSKSPNFNFLLYRSAYDAYNWENNFKNEHYKNIHAKIKTRKYGEIEAQFTNITNYTYFGLDNTFLFNNVSSGSDVFRVPTFSTRNTLYYETFAFKGKPMFLQMGITFRYFNKFYANNFNPLLNEFSIQNSTKIGSFPIMDFFINAQIQRTRIFFKVEHFNASFSGYNYYSAPNYPYRDLSIRFGLVWNFFI